ncbi:MAG: primosomal protein N' [Pleurocapsa minor GSE-CHR-MK-17-07R]|nr:primosomal protein N' [Pleurocapsa minor GSE-CHR-MK 17-07R]
MRYAHIVVNLPVDSEFTYAIPEALEGMLRAGHLVRVPFRTAEEYGVVVGLTDDAPDYQTKPISALIDPAPVVSPREIALARWTAKRYAAPLGLCLWAWIPNGMTAHSDIQVTLIDETIPPKTPLETEIIVLLKRRGALRGRQLDFAFPGENWRGAVDDLTHAGITRRESVLAPPRVKPRIIEMAALAIHPRRIDEAVQVMARPSKTADLLDYLARQKGPVDARIALKAAGATRTHLETLVSRKVADVTDDDQAVLTAWPDDVPALLSEYRKTEKPLRVLRVLARQSTTIDVSWLFAQTGANMNDLRRMEEADLILLGEKQGYRDSLADTAILPLQPPQLTESQAEVLEPILSALDNHETRTFLLHGVTGSGKTEIYLRAIERVLAQGRSALFLVPEIALTPQTIRRVAGRFPSQAAVVHSGLSEAERYDTWRRAREGLIQIVVGPRSALFTPLQDIGLIVLDEEHDPSYKHSPPMLPPYYDARRMAEAAAYHDNAVVIFGSATPDITTLYRSTIGEITRLTLPDRIMGHRERIHDQARTASLSTAYQPAVGDSLTIDLPPVQVVDMRAELRGGNTSIFSRALHDALDNTLRRKEQAILFMNRRGQATYVFCRDCGYVVTCPRCDTPLTYHRHGHALRCHKCDHTEPEPNICPSCSSRRIKFFGAGTQQVEEAVIQAFPFARILRWDADTAATQAAHDTILQRFMHHQADVLIGTQMIAKGLDLPMVTLVGVVSADVGLNLPDFRAGERTFQVLTQVAGRAGRGLLGGKVVLQTYQPEHYAIQAAAQHNYADFFAQELDKRRAIGYPPFRRLVRVLIRLPGDARAQAEAERAAALIRQRISKLDMTGTEVIGPAPCFFTRENDMSRWHVIVRGPDPLPIFDALPVREGWYVDVDPVEVL